MTKAKLILNDLDGSKDHLIADTCEETFTLNVDVLGVKNEIELGIPDLIKLNLFITKHLCKWDRQ